MNEKFLAGLGLFGAMLLAPGCTNAPASNPQSLRDVEIPAGFTFATTRAVTLDLVVEDPGAIERGVAVEVRHPGGRMIYRGPVPARGLRVPLPTHEDAVDVTSIHQGFEKTERVALAEAETRVVLR